MTIPQVVPKPDRRAFIRLGRTVRFVSPIERAGQIAFYGPLHVITDYQIQLAVAIVVKERRGRAEFVRSPQPRLLRNVSKGSVVIIVEQMVLPERGDEQIIVSVIVVVADCHPETV